MSFQNSRNRVAGCFNADRQAERIVDEVMAVVD